MNSNWTGCYPRTLTDAFGTDAERIVIGLLAVGVLHPASMSYRGWTI
jgi:hypothetical protein